MEVIFLIGLVALLYIVPEVLRSQRKTEYEYPDIPQAKPKPKLQQHKALPHIPPAVESHPKLQAKDKFVMPPAVEAPKIIDEKPEIESDWAKGIILTEVLMPPRAKRPIFYHKKM